MTSLYIVPCSARKNPELITGPLPAREAYTGQAFKIARHGLEKRCEKWCILSGLYGFLWPDTRIEYYDVKMEPVTDAANWFAFDALKQKQYGKLMCAERIVVLGSRLYADAAAKLLRREVEAPVAGLPIGKMMQAIKQLLKG